MQTQPKRVTSELLDRLNDLANSTLPSEEITTAIQQVLFRAQGLRNANTDEYYAVQGICASLQGDVEGLVEAFETGLEKGGWSEFLFHNYVTSLDDICEFELIADVARRCIVELAHEPRALYVATTMALHAGDVRVAAEAQRLLTQNFRTFDENSVDDEQAGNGIINFVDAAGKDPERLDRIDEVIRTTRRFLKLRGPRRMLATSRFTDGPFGNPHLVLGYAPAEQSEQVVGLERELFTALSEGSVDDETFDWMTIGLARKKTYASVLHP